MGGVALAMLMLAAACAENRTPTSGPDGGAPPVSLDCLPNLDHRIDADELTPAVGVPARYLVSSGETPVDLAGEPSGDGARVWDFSADVAGDRKITLAASPLASHAFSDAFPGGQLAVPLDADATLYQILSTDDNALYLHGVASADETTVLAYDAPVPLYRFPLLPGDAWTVTGTISGGELDGLPYVGTDTYQIAVDAVGRVDLPHLSFEQALRVSTLVTTEPAAGGVTVTRRQTSFLFECFGEVARATSRPNEPAADFSVAAELRRFSL